MLGLGGSLEPVLDRFRVDSLSVRDALRYCPHERRAMVFEISAIFGASVLNVPGLGDFLKWWGRGFAVVLQAVSPAFDVDMGQGRPPPDAFVRICTYAAPLTFFFCYVGTLLRSEDFLGLPFLDDWWNFVITWSSCPSTCRARFS